MVFADEDSPVFLMGAFDAAAAMMENQPKVQAAFKTGGRRAMGRPARLPVLRVGALFPARLSREPRRQVAARARRRRRQARAPAQRWPTSAAASGSRPCSWPRLSRSRTSSASTFMQRRSTPRGSTPGQHGVANVRFEVAKAKEFPGSDYDLVTFFDCLHDMGDPRGRRRARAPGAEAGRHLDDRRAAGRDRPEDNLNAVGRLYYSASTMICVPTSLAQEVGAALGAQAGEKRSCVR